MGSFLLVQRSVYAQFCFNFDHVLRRHRLSREEDNLLPGESFLVLPNQNTQRRVSWLHVVPHWALKSVLTVYCLWLFHFKLGLYPSSCGCSFMPPINSYALPPRTLSMASFLTSFWRESDERKKADHHLLTQYCFSASFSFISASLFLPERARGERESSLR